MRRDLCALGSPGVVTPTNPENAGRAPPDAVVVGAAVTASSGAAASAPSAGMSAGVEAGAGSPAAPTDATAGCERLAVVERWVDAAVLPVAALVVAGGVVTGAFVVGGVVVAGAAVVGVVLGVGGQRAGRRVQRPSREVAPAGLAPAQSTAALANSPVVAATPTRRIQRSIVMGGATLPWRCDRDQHNFAGPD